MKARSPSWPVGVFTAYPMGIFTLKGGGRIYGESRAKATSQLNFATVAGHVN